MSRLPRSQCVSLTVWTTKDNWVLFVSQLCFGYCCFAVPPALSPESSCCQKNSFVLGTRCTHLPVAAGFSSHTRQSFQGMSFAHVNVYPYPKSILSPACWFPPERRVCGLTLEGGGGRPGWCSRSRGSWSLLGTCHLWLAHSSVWPGMASGQHQPFATTPADPLPGPALPAERRGGRAGELAQVSAMCLCQLVPVTTARCGDCVRAHESPQVP